MVLSPLRGSMLYAFPMACAMGYFLTPIYGVDADESHKLNVQTPGPRLSPWRWAGRLPDRQPGFHAVLAARVGSVRDRRPQRLEGHPADLVYRQRHGRQRGLRISTTAERPVYCGSK